jgi:hypothetical protein
MRVVMPRMEDSGDLNAAEPDRTEQTNSRREFMKRTAVTGGALAWAVPTIKTFHLQAGTTGTPPPVEPPTDPPTLTARIVGTVIDASKGFALAGVTVTTSTGATTTTAANGSYVLDDVPALMQTIVASIGGYVSATFTIVVASGGTTTQNFVLSKLGDLRIVLTWNHVDSDLDLHASGPDGSGGRFHVSFADQHPVDHATLDIDDTSFEGPETVTVKISQSEGDFVAGDYHVWVHNFPSGTDVADFVAAAPVVTFSDRVSQAGQWSAADATGASTDRIWRVFDFTINDAGEVTTTNVVQTCVPGNAATVF